MNHKHEIEDPQKRQNTIQFSLSTQISYTGSDIQ